MPSFTLTLDHPGTAAEARADVRALIHFHLDTINEVREAAGQSTISHADVDAATDAQLRNGWELLIERQAIADVRAWNVQDGVADAIATAEDGGFDQGTEF